jgi:hypothetical protein
MNRSIQNLALDVHNLMLTTKVICVFFMSVFDRLSSELWAYLKTKKWVPFWALYLMVILYICFACLEFGSFGLD